MNGAGYEGDWDGGVKHGVGRWMSNQKAPIRKRYPYKIFEKTLFLLLVNELVLSHEKAPVRKRYPQKSFAQ
jgi:hypothetical protein